MIRGAAYSGRAWLALLAATAALPGCGDAEAPRSETAKKRVAVSIPPQAFFLREIAGDRVEIEVVVAPGQSPHSFEPTPQQVARLTTADVYFSIGVGFEGAFLPKLRAMSPKTTFVDTTTGIKMRSMSGACCAAHAGQEHEHSGAPDPHVWMDPRLVKTQAQTMAAALAQADPPHAAEYQRNAAALAERLEALHAAIAEKLAPFKSREFFVFHPAYGYFADAYGLVQVAVETNGREPGPAELTTLIDRAKAAGVRTIFYQPQYADKSARAIAAAIGGDVKPMDELAGDYVANLHRMADDLVRSFGGNTN